MLTKNLLFIILTLGICSLALSQTPENPDNEQSIQPSNEPAPDSASDTISLTEADYRLFGERMLASGKYMSKTYNAYSIVPGTWRWMGQKMEEGDAFSAILGVIILPFDLAFTRLYGGFVGAYNSGKAGDQFISASRILPPQQASLMEMSGKNLKTGRTFGVFGNATFYGGLTLALVQLYGNSSEDESASRPKPIAGLGAMALGYCLKLVSVQYTGSAGSGLQKLSASFPVIELSGAIGDAGKELRDYRSYSYWGTALMGAGIGIFSASKEDDSLATVGLATAVVGWVIASPVAAYNIKNVAAKLQEAGDRMMHWKE